MIGRVAPNKKRNIPASPARVKAELNLHRLYAQIRAEAKARGEPVSELAVRVEAARRLGKRKK